MVILIYFTEFISLQKRSGITLESTYSDMGRIKWLRDADDKQMSHHLEHQVSKCSVTMFKCPHHPIGSGSSLGGNLTELTQSETGSSKRPGCLNGREGCHLQGVPCGPGCDLQQAGLQRRGLLRPIHASQTTKHTAFSRMPADVFKVRNISAN